MVKNDREVMVLKELKLELQRKNMGMFYMKRSPCYISKHPDVITNKHPDVLIMEI